MQATSTKNTTCHTRPALWWAHTAQTLHNLIIARLPHLPRLPPRPSNLQPFPASAPCPAPCLQIIHYRPCPRTVPATHMLEMCRGPEVEPLPHSFNNGNTSPNQANVRRVAAHTSRQQTGSPGDGIAHQPVQLLYGAPACAVASIRLSQAIQATEGQHEMSHACQGYKYRLKRRRLPAASSSIPTPPPKLTPAHAGAAARAAAEEHALRPCTRLAPLLV
jgi:hypothetical protein